MASSFKPLSFNNNLPRKLSEVHGDSAFTKCIPSPKPFRPDVEVSLIQKLLPPGISQLAMMNV
jgi:hypothetical protein